MPSVELLAAAGMLWLIMSLVLAILMGKMIALKGIKSTTHRTRRQNGA